ncbi:recombination-associated protein RdgC [Pectobacterium brasiliense]|uniref:recombination-associated protein RdgC n=1 Tax=Pectobacterium brasiliense TaxID=180957 RepID=UPI000B977493|nr:recombination-associated protein RdgC [Pectobacterium carotovorum]OYN53230.1 hypothetical protein B7L51_01145 [Pectobacterium carotovorum]
MKTFKTLFPYKIDIVLPNNIAELIELKPFNGLNDSSRSASGFAIIGDDFRSVISDGRVLVKYVSASRTANSAAVKQLTNERIDSAIAAGRDITENVKKELEDQAHNEIIRYAPISTWSAYLLICPSEHFIFAAGGNAKKCEEALSLLRHTLGRLPVLPWGFGGIESRMITLHLTSADPDAYKLPDNLAISRFGKTVVTGTGEDTSLKLTLDGVRNDTKEAKALIEGMAVRAAEMSLVERPANGQIKNLADFVLHLPLSGNPHLKRFDYDNDDPGYESAETEHHRCAVEMLLVAKTTTQILKSLESFFGVSDDDDQE